MANNGTDNVSVLKATTNSAPTANPDPTYSVVQGGSLTVPREDGVLANDTDTENDPLTATMVSEPTNGMLTTLAADGSFTYTPNTGFSGSDSFTYKANDGKLDSNTATVTITVTQAADTTRPTVSSVTPTTTTKVPLTAKMSATFSEEMKDTTLNSPSTNFKLQKLTGKGKNATYVDVPGVSVTSEVIPGLNSTQVTKATLTPISSLTANTTYKAIVTSGDTGATDLAGLTLAADKVWTFKTASR